MQIVTDPRTGLPSKFQWLPTIKEVREACDEAQRAMTDRVKRERDIAAQMAERARFEREQRAKAERTPEQQARINAMVEETRRTLGAASEARPAPERDTAPEKAHNTELMRREYAAAGRTPVYAGDGRMISLALANSLAEHRKRNGSTDTGDAV